MIDIILILCLFAGGIAVFIGWSQGAAAMEQYGTIIEGEIKDDFYIVLPGANYSIGNKLTLTSSDGIIDLKARLVATRSNRRNEFITIINGAEGRYGFYHLNKMDIAGIFSKTADHKSMQIMVRGWPGKISLPHKYHLAFETFKIELAGDSSNNSNKLSSLSSQGSTMLNRFMASLFKTIKITATDLKLLNGENELYFSCKECTFETDINPMDSLKIILNRLASGKNWISSTKEEPDFIDCARSNESICHD